MVSSPTAEAGLTVEVKKLKEIFENRSEEELMAILWRYNNDVEATVGAILGDETVSFDNNKTVPSHVLPPTQHQSLSHFTLRNKICMHPAPSPSKPSLFSPFTRKIQSMANKIPPPQRMKRECSADQRRRILLGAQREAWEHKESEFQHVLRASFPLQEFGSDFITDEEGTTKIYKHNNVNQACTRKIRGAPKATKIPPVLRNKFKMMLDSIEQARMSQVRVPKTNNGEELVKQLEVMERETKEACKHAIEDHLKSYLKEYPNASYENWIKELHPENVGEKYSLEENSKTVDHRFYLERSDHRIIWNSSLATKRKSNTSPGNNQKFVSARCCKKKKEKA